MNKKLFTRIASFGLSFCVLAFQCDMNIVLAKANKSEDLKEASEVELVTNNEERELNLPKEFKFNSTEKSLVNESIKYALDSGEKAAEKISEISDEDTYNEAVSKVLNEYYDVDSVDSEVKNFVDNLRPCASEIITNYEEAYQERRKGESLGYNPEKIIVQYESDISDSSIEESMDVISDGGELVSNEPLDDSLPQYKLNRINKAKNSRKSKIGIVSLAKDQTTQKAIKEFEAIEGVKDAERDVVVEEEAVAISNDTYSSNQWGLIQTNVSGAWKILERVKANTYQVWTAVIDTGLDVTHPDLQGQYLKKFSVDVTGENSVLLSEMDKPYTSNHGTHVAGIISAKVNNSVGIAGVAGVTDASNDQLMSCKVMAIKISDQNTGSMNTSGLVKGIYYAVDHGAEVINMSLSYSTSVTSVQTAINYAYAAGVTVVAAAGNNNVTTACYPSDCNHVISVIATNENKQKSSFSNYGSKKDISAPGENILSTVPGGAYVYLNGTSMASPFVAGVIAMMKEIEYSLDPDEMEAIIKNTAYDIGDKGWDEETAYGRIDPYNAILSVASKYK